jgi:lambda repressor-like predicted transcriptional regulator
MFIMHPEDIKAELRKRHGSMTAFAEARGLPRQSVSNLLCGRISRPVAKAIAEELNMPLKLVFPDIKPFAYAEVSRKSDDNAICTPRKQPRVTRQHGDLVVAS